MTIRSYFKPHLIPALALSFCGISATHSQTAQQITPSNAPQLVQNGLDATGGIGDWSLSNGVLCAIISGVEHESEFSTKGGALIDLGFCERDDDLYTFSQDLIDAKRTRPLDAQSIHTKNTEDSSSIIVESIENGITQTTHYKLDTHNLTQLHISKTLTRHNENDSNEFNILSSVNFNLHSLEPFIFASNDLSQSTGFIHQEFVKTGIKALPKAAKKADTIISLSPPNAVEPIAYGWHLESVQRIDSNGRYDLPWFALADNSSNAFLYLSDTFYIGDGSQLGWIQLSQIPFLSLDQGSKIQVEQTIYVGKKADVASITDQFFTDGVKLSGTSDEPNSAIHIDQLNGTPLTHIRPNSDGSFEAMLPKGNYTLRHIGNAGRQSQREIKLEDNHVDLGSLSLPNASMLNLPQGKAMRLVIKGINGTPSPALNDTLTQLVVIDDGEKKLKKTNSQVFLSGKKGDKESIRLAPGDYRIYATRGPEYSLEKVEITLKKREIKTLQITTPQHVLDTPNYIASDLHVHSGISYDNNFSPLERVRTFVAEHGEVMVASEHDIPVDFAPFINKLGVQNKITSIAAAEVTSLLPSERLPYTGGHINVFPFTPKPYAFRRGMIKHEDRRLREIIHDVHQIEPSALIQLNHPRTNLDFSSNKLPSDFHEHIDFGHYLDHMGVGAHPYNPEQPLHTHPNKVLTEKDPQTGLRDIDFDLIELINPGGPDHETRLQAVRKDWLSFLKQGEKIVATANSDSHGSNNQVAVPRTMVAMENDQVTHFDQTAFLASLKSGNAYGTTGPMIEINLSGKSMGEMHQGQTAMLEATISSVDWINIKAARIQVNGETIKEVILNDKAVNNLVRQTLSIPLRFEQDAFVTVEVIGDVTPDYQVIYPEISPYAFTNAIYVDADSDGQWQAPGL